MATQKTALFNIKNPKSFLKGFGKGLFLVLIAYGGILTYAATQKPRILKQIEDSVPMETLELSFEEISPMPLDNKNEVVKKDDDKEKILEIPLHKQDKNSDIAHTPETEPIHPEIPVITEGTAEHHHKEQQHHTVGYTDINTLYEHTEYGVLPKEITDTTSPTVYETFKSKVPKSVYRKPVISIIYLTPEKSEDLAKSAINSFPAEITFFLSPYDKNIESTKELLIQENHEIWLKLYIGNDDLTTIDTGHLSLSGSTSSEDNITRLQKTISTTTKFVGIAIPNNAPFLARQYSIKPILRQIQNYGLGITILDANDQTQYISDYAKEVQMPFAQTNIFIDEIPLQENIIEKLESLKEIATKQGYAVGYMEGYPNSIEIVSHWLNEQPDEDFNLVPLSAIADQTNQSKMKQITTPQKHN